MRFFKISLFISAALLTSCNPTNKESKPTDDTSNNTTLFHSVTAIVQTAPVSSEADAADDPSIWVHPSHPEKSLLITTNKKNGIDIYDLNGQLQNSQPLGKLNNVDIRYNFILGSDTIDIAAASNRTDNTVSIYKIDSDTPQLIDISSEIYTTYLEEVYGFCLYKSQQTGKFYANVVGKTGKFEQFEIQDNGSGKVNLLSVRQFQLPTQAEGMVADDELGFLYINEENNGIWKYGAEPNTTDKKLIDAIHGENGNQQLAEDLEGISIYYGANHKGYLIASSQGNNSYAIYSREGDNAYIGSFKIDNSSIDGTEDTDGLDVINMQLGDKFPYGFFIAQDGANIENGDTNNQNFKLVDWSLIASKMDLMKDNSYNIRK